jgi:drug/metabolite transporter (DMT)-like permease
VPAAAMTLLAQSETVFVPVWVFLAFGERPGPATLVGASIIMAAVIMKVLLDTRPPRAIPVPAP